MASEVYITVEDLKGATVIQNNIEPKLLSPYIKIAQDIHIDKILGAALVTAFKADLDLVGTSIEATTQRFIDLLVFVKEAMYYCVATEASVFLAVRITNKGINRRFSESTSSADLSEVKEVEIKFSNYAEHYKSELLCFLKDNESTYPEFKENNCEDDCKKANFSYFSGIQFDKRNRLDHNKL